MGNLTQSIAKVMTSCKRMNSNIKLHEVHPRGKGYI
jgi:hypothetical protein